MSTDAEYEAILREMAVARRELVEDAREVVSNARELTDWRTYVRQYPWLFAGAAFVVGYALIPAARRPAAPTAAAENGPPPPKSAGWTSAAVALASSAALRIALSYAGHQLENWLESPAHGRQASRGQGHGNGHGNGSKREPVHHPHRPPDGDRNTTFR